ncbi:PKD domain-containing protein [Puia sp.]|jgi:hypothetical protein|uniref:PKD domain-containing protein n=1 Tax=Puia sp. TaxID=2045100 RepID=UPI002F404294
MKKILLCFFLCSPLIGFCQTTISSIVVAEYRTWYIRSDSTIWTFNNNSLHPVQCVLGSGLKTIGGSGAFNYFRMLDATGYVWTSKPINVSINPNSATRMDTDTTGAAFSGNWYVNAYGHAFVTIRADSSAWYGGKDVFSMFYSGGNLNTQTGTTMAPGQLSPAGMKFKKVLMANVRIIGLTTAGDVYVWTAGGSRTPTKMTTPRPAIDIFMSSLDFQGCIIPDATGSQTMGYPYVWGGATSMYGGSTPFTQPTSIKALWNMTVPIREISVDHNTIHYIDSTGKLWGTGFNSSGEVGNGQEFVNKYYYPGYPGYGWTFTDYENPTGLPVQISSKTDWKHLYSNNWFGFYKYASDNNDSIYSWGRNKALVLGNGLQNYEEATSPNAQDVLTPTLVHPLPTTFQLYDFTPPTLSAGTNQAISTSTAALTATGNPALLIAKTHPAANGIDTAGYSWVSYAWSQLSGPSTASISSPNANSTPVSGLTNGTYVFRILATDNNTGQDTAQVQVTVTLVDTLYASPLSITGLNGTAGTAGTPQTVTVTFSATTINASAPTNTEISKDSGATYASSQTLGSVSPVDLKIRTTAAAPAGSISGNLVLSGTGVSTINIPVTGTVSPLVTTPDSARFQFLITSSLLVSGWQGVMGDPSLAVLSGTISGTTITYTTVSTSSSNWGQFAGACIGANNGVTNATIPDMSNRGVMKEAVLSSLLYQTTNPQFISGGWKTDGTTYDIELSGTTQYSVSAVGSYNVRGSTLNSPLAISGSGNTSSKVTWTNVSPDASGNFTFYFGKNNSGEQVGMLSYIKIKKHSGTGGSATNGGNLEGSPASFGNGEKNPVSLVYPNPTNGQLRVYFTSPPLGKAGIVLVDAGGHVLQQRIQSGGQLEMDISSFPAGIYTLRVQQGTNVFTYQVVKQ